MSFPMPAHLPEKLSIGMFIWNWIVDSGPGGPYHDLEKCVAGLKARGFNSVRLEAGYNWAFDLEGRPRGPVAFGPWIEGFGWNLSSFSGRAAGRVDVLKRVLALFRLAEKYGIFVILTSWEYQDSTSFLADRKLRDEVNSVPTGDRFAHMARQLAHMIDALKNEGLEKQIAFAEIHNEPEASAFPNRNGYRDDRALHEAAIKYLRAKHPDILIAYDSGGCFPDAIPESAQVLNMHIYGGWYEQQYGGLWAQTVRARDFDPHKPLEHAPTARLLKKDFVPWDKYQKAAQNFREYWRPVMWLYDNLDNAKWDAFAAEQFRAGNEEKIRGNASKKFAAVAAEAARRALPLVIGEGGFYYPPRLSRFELTRPALDVLELFTDLAIKYNYWGVMPGTYVGAEHLVWDEQPGWLRGINARFQEGRLSGEQARRSPRTQAG